MLHTGVGGRDLHIALNLMPPISFWHAQISSLTGAAWVLSIDFGCHSGDCPLSVWHFPGWRVVTQDSLPSLDSGSLAEVVLNWIWSPSSLQTEKIEGGLAGWNCSFTKSASILPDLPGGGIWTIIISINTLSSCPSLIIHALWRQGVPHCPPHIIRKPEISLLLLCLFCKW